MQGHRTLYQSKARIRICCAYPLLFDLEFDLEGHAVGIFEDKIWRQKTKIVELPYGEDMQVFRPTTDTVRQSCDDK